MKKRGRGELAVPCNRILIGPGFKLVSKLVLRHATLTRGVSGVSAGYYIWSGRYAPGTSVFLCTVVVENNEPRFKVESPCSAVREVIIWMTLERWRRDRMGYMESGTSTNPMAALPKGYQRLRLERARPAWHLQTEDACGGRVYECTERRDE